MVFYDLAELDSDTLYRAVGLIGFSLYVFAFFGLSIGRIDSTKPLYFGLTFAASCCVMVSLWVDFNLSAALIQAFYICMSLGAIVLRLRSWRSRGVLG